MTKQFDKKTILNDIITQMNKAPGYSSERAQATGNVLNSISAGKSKLKPLPKRNICNYPNASRKDNFDMNRGLGAVSLQPQIDQLNQFKQNCIKAIKTKFEAMGPETVKDSKLAAGSITVIKEVLEAAKCFSQMVKNVNNLIDSYIQTIVQMTAFLVAVMEQLQNQIETIRQSLIKFPGELLNVTVQEILKKISLTTNIFEILSLVVQLQVEILKIQEELDYLSHSKERFLLSFEANVTLLASAINQFKRYLEFIGILKSSKDQANSLYMTDNFLDDFNFVDVEASSFNWSFTNSNMLNYNTYDELNILPRLNMMFSSYKEDGIDSIPLVIAAKTESGYIVMPETEESLISCGLDPSVNYGAGLVLELFINSGETVIRAMSRGEKLEDGDVVVTKQLGKYASKGLDNIEYTTIIYNGDGTWTLTANTNTSIVNIGGFYTLIDPATNLIDNSIQYIVTNKTQNTVTVSGPGPLPSLVNGKHVCPERTKEGDWVMVSIAGNQIGDLYGVGISKLEGKTERYQNSKDLGLTILESEWLTWTQATDDGDVYLDGSIAVMRFDVYSFRLKKITRNSDIQEVPHAGEKIPCLNWSLSVYPIGDAANINKIQFSSSSLDNPVESFFLKAHWGFIPEEISTVKKADIAYKARTKFVSDRRFHLETLDER